MSQKRLGITSSTLHIAAMLLMLCDHLCLTVMGNFIWLHYIGRIAFPIFAFMLAEGFRRTGSIKKYMLRLLIFAVISEIPFNMMLGGTLIYPVQQNVLWTFIISILCMLLTEQPKKIKNPFGRYSVFAVTALTALILGFIAGSFTMVDYFGGGVVMVLVFHLFYGDEILSFKVNYRKEWMRTTVIWVNRILQLVLVWNVCSEMIGGLCTNISVFGREYEVVVECFGILALIPVWLYNGEKGIRSKKFRYLCYAFYPAHIAVLVALRAVLF